MTLTIFWEFVTPAAVLASILFGYSVGAFYGFKLSHDKPIVYPYALWIVGLGFVTLLGFVAYSDRGLRGEMWIEFTLARGVLWTILCLFIPIGRMSRVRYETWRIDHKISRLHRRNGEPAPPKRNRRGETAIQAQDRHVGDERRLAQAEERLEERKGS